MNQNEIYISRCIELAKKGLGLVSPNPLVGSVVVHNDKIIGEGYHHQYGSDHAEVCAIKSVKNKSLLPKSTIYVNLEPCAHHGKTPPCSDLIIKNKIPKVVIGCVDTFSEVAGKGIQRLREHGIEVITPVLEKESRNLNKRFFSYHEKKRPYIILKWAQSEDGFIAPEESLHHHQRWITTEETKTLVHSWRAQEDAILVGKNTVLKDNPSLTARDFFGKNPARIILGFDQSFESKAILNDGVKTIIFNSSIEKSIGNVVYIKETNLSKILDHLWKENIQSMIIEGGKKVLQSFIDQGYYDEVKLLKGNVFLNQGIKAPILPKSLTWKTTQFNNDQLHIGKVHL